MIGVKFDTGAQVFLNTDTLKAHPRQSGVEVLRVAQSFDPCIACAVH